ncbi:MAG: hypothetical protein IIW81_03955, partial [Oscillospiraceae bacterium]|nr:hypothetical protein [Oscillospiraceae bacterium]
MLQLYWSIAAFIDFLVVYNLMPLSSVWTWVAVIPMHVLILAILCGLHLLFLIVFSFVIDEEDVTDIHNIYRTLLLYS